MYLYMYDTNNTVCLCCRVLSCVAVQHASSDVERLLIGNKCDWDAKRAISTERGRQLASSQGISFLETSAKTNHNIDQVTRYM